MSAATVTRLHPPSVTRLADGPGLPRARRRTELERLLEDATIGVPPSDTARAVLLAAFASSSLTAGQAEAKWTDLVAETRRLQAVEAGEPEWRDLQPGLAQADYGCALADLLDGTSTYRGDRI